VERENLVMANIFENEADESPTTVIRKTMKVSIDDSGIPVVSFATNRGKGSGAQTMPVTQFAEYVTAMEEIASSGIPEEAESNLSAAESLRQTVRCEDGIVSFRVRSGKGSKPAKVPTEALSGVAKLLRKTVAQVEAAGLSLAPAAETASVAE